MPRVRISLTTGAERRMLAARSLSGDLGVTMKYHSTLIIEMLRPHTVARAEPGIPQPSTMTKR